MASFLGVAICNIEIVSVHDKVASGQCVFVNSFSELLKEIDVYQLRGNCMGLT